MDQRRHERHRSQRRPPRVVGRAVRHFAGALGYTWRASRSGQEHVGVIPISTGSWGSVCTIRCAIPGIWRQRSARSRISMKRCARVASSASSTKRIGCIGSGCWDRHSTLIWRRRHRCSSFDPAAVKHREAGATRLGRMPQPLHQGSFGRYMSRLAGQSRRRRTGWVDTMQNSLPCGSIVAAYRSGSLFLPRDRMIGASASPHWRPPANAYPSICGGR
jgi:hypothetical protein